MNPVPRPYVRCFGVFALRGSPERSPGSDTFTGVETFVIEDFRIGVHLNTHLRGVLWHGVNGIGRGD